MLWSKLQKVSVFIAILAILMTSHQEQVQAAEPVSSERLAALDPAKPADYREYAEELLARRGEPVARDTAIRLYVIAAWLDRANLGRPALLGLIALARSPEEEKRFRAALYLIDPRTRLEAVQVGRQGPAEKEDRAAARELLRALRLLRTGKGPTARAIIEKPTVGKLLESYSRILTRAEFTAAGGQTVLSPRDLRQTLLLELEMEAILDPAAAADSKSTSLTWSQQLQGTGSEAVPSFDLETLTEFDPRQSVYRNGKWVKP